MACRTSSSLDMGIFEPRWLVELCERAPTCTRVTQALEEFDTRQRIQRGAFRETNAKKVGHVLRILAQQKELSVKLVAAINENRLVDSLLVRGSLIELEKAASRASSSGTVDDLMENSINYPGIILEIQEPLIIMDVQNVV